MPDHTHRRTTNSTADSNAGSGPSTDDNLQDLVGNAAIVDYIKANNTSTGQRELDPNKNGIVVIGMNKDAASEARALNQYNRGSGGAVSATPGSKQDVLRVDGVDVDLSTEEGAAVFATSLGIPDQLAVNVAQFLVDAGDEARDELGKFIKILSQAEMGERKIDRMVLSGHSVGSQIWGDDNGEIMFDEFADLFEMFPKAAGQVRHLMFSACYAGGETHMMDHREMLPGVESIWAYHDSSPGTWSGALLHMESWVNATMPGKDASGVDPEVAGNTRKAENISTWNSTDGYQGADALSMYELESAIDGQESMFQRFFSGASEVENSQTGPLREYYGLVQRALGHPDASPELVSRMEKRRDTVIRLLYFSLVSRKFQEHNRAKLDAGLREAGLGSVNLETLGRGGLAKLIADLEAAGGTNAQAALDLLKRGLWELDPDLVPTSWV